MIDNPGVCSNCVLRIRTRPAFWEAERLRAATQEELHTKQAALYVKQVELNAKAAEANALRSQLETKRNDEIAAIQWANLVNLDRLTGLVDHISSSSNVSEWGYLGEQALITLTEDTIRKIPDQMIAVMEFYPLISNFIPAGTQCYAFKTALGEGSFYWCP